MKKLNKIEIKLLKNFIIRKQDFPVYLDRDVFIYDFSGFGDFRFIDEYKGDSEDFCDTYILASTINLNEKEKVNKLIISVNLLLNESNKLEYYDLSYNCIKFLNQINICIDRLDNQIMDGLLNDCKNILNGKT
jgi:hypothetical protein